MSLRYNAVFNFAASYQSGGLKRLQEFSRWFDANGGACFIIHPNCNHLIEEFPDNLYFSVRQSTLQRLLGDTSYLRAVRAQIGAPELYYAYGMPVFERIGDVNWFHLSNVLPFDHAHVPLSPIEVIKFRILGWQIERTAKYADVISAESRSSLAKLPFHGSAKLELSVNGSDDELALQGNPDGPVDNIAVVVGTVRYKALDDSYRIYSHLRDKNPQLKLVVFGREDWIPDAFRAYEGVEIAGQRPRDVVIEHLKRARYYISTTLVENSYNAASEGVFLARESFLSDIGPHRELLADSTYKMVTVPGLSRIMLNVQKADAVVSPLRTWDQVVSDVLSTTDRLRKQSAHAR